MADPVIATDFVNDPVEKARRQWAARHGDESGFMVVVSMLRGYAVMLRELERVLKPLGLTLSRFEVLLLLSFARDERLPVMRIRDLLMVHGSSATYLVDRLQERGWVDREADPTDRRVSFVTLTTAGRARLEEGIARLVADGWGPVDRLDEDGRRAIVELLAQMRGIDHGGGSE